jgi:phosphoglycolate phosphatase-like HAD superfamily hydrolase
VCATPGDNSPMQTRNFDLIAFDWDGTLFDSTIIIVRCIQEAVRDVGGTVPTDKEAGLRDRPGADAGAGPCRARRAA